MKKLVLIGMMCLLSATVSLAQNAGNTYQNYICEGTTWIYRYVDLHLDESCNWYSTERFSREWLEGTEIINGISYLKVWGGAFDETAEPDLRNYIRVAGDKVYLRQAKENGIEKLLFDYAMQPGNSQEMSVITCTLPGYDCTAECVDSSSLLNCGNVFESLDIKFTYHYEYEDEYQPWETPAIWIKGIGGIRGLDINSPCEGKSHLYEVYHNGELIYKNPEYTSGIDSVEEKDSQISNGRRYHIDGREFREGDKGIYIENGQKYIK